MLRDLPKETQPVRVGDSNRGCRTPISKLSPQPPLANPLEGHPQCPQGSSLEKGWLEQATGGRIWVPD